MILADNYPKVDSVDPGRLKEALEPVRVRAKQLCRLNILARTIFFNCALRAIRAASDADQGKNTGPPTSEECRWLTAMQRNGGNSIVIVEIFKTRAASFPHFPLEEMRVHKPIMSLDEAVCGTDLFNRLAPSSRKPCFRQSHRHSQIGKSCPLLGLLHHPAQQDAPDSYRDHAQPHGIPQQLRRLSHVANINSSGTFASPSHVAQTLAEYFDVGKDNVPPTMLNEASAFLAGRLRNVLDFIGLVQQNLTRRRSHK
jgi:hypothetical protein